MFCRKCGEENLEEAVFCKNCGARLKEEEVKKATVIETPTEKENTYTNQNRTTTTTTSSNNGDSGLLSCCICLIGIFIIFAIIGLF